MECVCLAEVALSSSHGALMKKRGVGLSLGWVNGVAP